MPCPWYTPLTVRFGVSTATSSLPGTVLYICSRCAKYYMYLRSWGLAAVPDTGTKKMYMVCLVNHEGATVLIRVPLPLSLLISMAYPTNMPSILKSTEINVMFAAYHCTRNHLEQGDLPSDIHELSISGSYCIRLLNIILY